MVALSISDSLTPQVAASPVQDMGPGTKFQPVLIDAADNAQRVVVCSGKHYYTLKEAANASDKPVTFIRIEELSPFPAAELKEALQAVEGENTPVIFAQEEPENAGAWSYVRPRLDAVLADLGRAPSAYAGRKAGATTAVGVGAWHKAEMEAIVKAALEP